MIVIEKEVGRAAAGGRRFHADLEDAVPGPAQRTKAQDDRNSNQAATTDWQVRPRLLVIPEDRKRYIFEPGVSHSKLRSHRRAELDPGTGTGAQGAIRFVNRKA